LTYNLKEFLGEITGRMTNLLVRVPFTMCRYVNENAEERMV
jgi:hypothetical protein